MVDGKRSRAADLREPHRCRAVTAASPRRNGLPGGSLGFIDITDPAHPAPAGRLLPDPNPADALEYEPTSVDVVDHRYAVAAVNTSASYTSPSGMLAVVDLAWRTIVREISLGGQPDSVDVSPNGRYIAIAIENERSETLCVGGGQGGFEAVDDEDYQPGVNTTEDLCEDGGGVVGGLPQTPYGNPAGYLVVVETKGPSPATWTRNDVQLTGALGIRAGGSGAGVRRRQPPQLDGVPLTRL